MDTYDLMPLSATDSCAQTSAGYVCTKALEHVGEHATHTAGGVVIKRWPNTQITPGDAVKDAAPASSGAPSLVELDRRQAADRLASAVEDVARHLRMVRSISDQHAYVTDMLAALDDYRQAVAR
jgi:hypothetical protein